MKLGDLGYAIREYHSSQEGLTEYNHRSDGLRK